MALDFYHGHGSPFSWRVWLALEAKRLAYNLQVLSFQDQDTKKPDFVALNPRGQVPTIVDDGYAIWESGAVLEYLEERFTQGPKLLPGDAKARGDIRRLAREAEAYLYAEGISPIVDELFWKGGEPADMERVAKWREVVRKELAYFDRVVAGDFVAGPAITLADVVLYPCVAYCKRITFRKPEAKLTELIPPRLAEWAKRVEALPYFDKTYPPHWR